jgi:hypothetical protein
MDLPLGIDCRHDTPDWTFSQRKTGKMFNIEDAYGVLGNSLFGHWPLLEMLQLCETK